MARPGSTVIPAGWSKHHQPVAEGTMTGACSITDPTATVVGEFNNTDGTYDRTPAAPYYAGPCRAQQQRQPQVSETGGQQVSTHDYLVTIPASVTAVKLGHLVEITAAEDASLVGLVLKVTDIQRGTEIWERDLICIDHL